MSEEPPPESNSPASAKGMPLRRRRGHRGGRGRGRGQRPPGNNDPTEVPPAVEPATPVESSAATETASPPGRSPEDPIRLSEERPVRPQPSRPLPPRPKFEPVAHAPRVPRTDGSAISQAVNEVMQIVASLKQTLEQMEEVLELVELAERQKLTDEREIESLLRALRQFQSRGEPSRTPERFNARSGSNRPERQAPARTAQSFASFTATPDGRNARNLHNRLNIPEARSRSRMTDCRGGLFQRFLNLIASPSAAGTRCRCRDKPPGHFLRAMFWQIPQPRRRFLE